MMIHFLLLGAGFWAGAQNALAGGGSFITLPALMVAGLDARSANITSTVALFPAQCSTGWQGRRLLEAPPGLPLSWVMGLSLGGGILGALLLLLTPSPIFERMIPWLILLATALFAWGSFGHKFLNRRRKSEAVEASLSALHLPPNSSSVPSMSLKDFPWKVALAQFFISVYGGYFGGGIGFLMMATYTLAGVPVRAATSLKNVLAALMNASAVLVFLFSGEVFWEQAVMLTFGAVAGGLLGSWMLHKVNENYLRFLIIFIGCFLTFALWYR